MQSARDAREPQVLATCKHLVAPSAFRPPAGFKPPSGEVQEYSIGAIPGVIAAGTRWRTVWSADGNNADGIVATPDGGLTDGGVFYAAANGLITQYGEGLSTNGIILSPDEKTLYVTNRDSLVAFDVQPDAALTHQREFGKLRGLGDGATIDADGRVYVTEHSAQDGIEVFSNRGEPLGLIPTPYPVISLTFSGPGKKTLFAVAETGKSPAQAAAILALPMNAAGYAGRAK